MSSTLRFTQFVEFEDLLRLLVHTAFFESRAVMLVIPHFRATPTALLRIHSLTSVLTLLTVVAWPSPWELEALIRAQSHWRYICPLYPRIRRRNPEI